MRTRQLAVVTASGEVKMIEQNVPERREGHALIKVHASLISPGTEIAFVKKRREAPDPGGKDEAIGYATAGEVLETEGDPRLEPGMRVFAMGDGYASHANYACVPVNLVVPIPDGVSYVDATYTCLAATSLQAVRRTVPLLGEYGAVLGLGIVGNICAQLSQLCGAHAIGWEGQARRLEIARQCGIRHLVPITNEDPAAATAALVTPYGLDFAIIAFGGDATAAYGTVIKLMKKCSPKIKMGRVTLVGGCQVTLTGGSPMGNVDILGSAKTGPGYSDTLYETGRDYPNGLVQFSTRRNLEEIVQLIHEKRLLVAPMTTDVFPLAAASDAVERLIERPDDAMGVVLDMTH